MYSRILVPVDGSSTALQGLQAAIGLAKALNAQVKLVSVVNELILDPALAPSAYYERVIENMRETGRKALSDAAAVAEAQDVSVETQLIETIGTRASDLIIAAAKEWRADLIAMGTHGRRGLSRLTLGSDAELVVRSAHVPVLLVREASKPRTAARTD